VISSALWQRLGANPAIIGQALSLDGCSYTVTGVMPQSFHLPVAGITSVGLRADFWMPLDPREQARAAYVAYARLRPDVSFLAAEADVKRVAAEIAAEDPRNHRASTARLFDLRETVIRDIRPTLLLLSTAVGLLVLITCANATSNSAIQQREQGGKVTLRDFERSWALLASNGNSQARVEVCAFVNGREKTDPALLQRPDHRPHDVARRSGVGRHFPNRAQRGLSTDTHRIELQWENPLHRP
jgi:hypothetical protein